VLRRTEQEIRLTPSVKAQGWEGPTQSTLPGVATTLFRSRASCLIIFGASENSAELSTPHVVFSCAEQHPKHVCDLSVSSKS